MSPEPTNHYQRCFISAPIGLELGALPGLLADRGISWEWAKDEPIDSHGPTSRIAAADFVLIVLNGTRADYRGVFDAGIAVGLGKPVLLIQAKARPIPLDFRQFTTVKASLSNGEALGFHLDLFLAAPPSTPSPPVERSEREHASRPSRTRVPQRPFETELEHRAYAAVLDAGGSAIAQPSSGREVRYRPDLLAWLGHLDAELLDPAVIEVRSRVDPKTARRLEEQLLSFMQAARVRTALVLTAAPPPEREQQLSPNVLWLTIDEFESLARTAQLGTHVRKIRNRIMHGAR